MAGPPRVASPSTGTTRRRPSDDTPIAGPATRRHSANGEPLPRVAFPQIGRDSDKIADPRCPGVHQGLSESAWQTDNYRGEPDAFWSSTTDTRDATARDQTTHTPAFFHRPLDKLTFRADDFNVLYTLGARGGGFPSAGGRQSPTRTTVSFSSLPTRRKRECRLIDSSQFIGTTRGDVSSSRWRVDESRSILRYLVFYCPES